MRSPIWTPVTHCKRRRTCYLCWYSTYQFFMYLFDCISLHIIPWTPQLMRAVTHHPDSAFTGCARFALLLVISIQCPADLHPYPKLRLTRTYSPLQCTYWSDLTTWQLEKRCLRHIKWTMSKRSSSMVLHPPHLYVDNVASLICHILRSSPDQAMTTEKLNTVFEGETSPSSLR